jgi:aerobic C4-dicarboxylate transport protein
MRFLRHTYAQVVLGILVGLALGVADPALAAAMKPFADGFVKLIKLCVGPIVFLAVVHGIVAAGDLRTAGRVGLKALLYFEALTVLAMLCGWAAGEVIRPGAGFNVDPRDLDAKAIQPFLGPPASASGDPLAIIPRSLLEPFVTGNVVQILGIAVVAGIALMAVARRAPVLVQALDGAAEWMFSLIRLVTLLAPLAAFGAISFTVGRYGLGALVPLAKLVLAYYAAAAVFVVVGLWTVLRWCGAPLGPFLRYIGDEVAIVFGTIASEAVMPRLMEKMERLGCRADVVRVVTPTAYSFNLDGTALYLVLAPLFISQACNIPLTWESKLSLFLLLMLTSKGAAGVTGGVLVTLVSTLVAHPVVPAAGLAITLGVDRFLNEGRAVLNLVGNAVAALAIARWDGALDRARMRAVLAGAAGEPAPAE